MNETYNRVLEKMQDVDPGLGQAILNQALKTAGTTPDDVSPEEMKQAYDDHLKMVLKKYDDTVKIKAVRTTIMTLNSEVVKGSGAAKSAATGSRKTLPKGKITETLYAQPNSEEPNLILNKLKDGTYEEGSVWGLSSVLRFTKVGEVYYQALQQVGSNTVIQLDDYSQLEDYKAWTMSLMSKDLSVTLKSIRYRPFANFPAAFFIQIKLDGDSEVARRVVQDVVYRLSYVPYNFNDWAAMEKKTGQTEKSIKKAWGRFL